MALARTRCSQAPSSVRPATLQIDTTAPQVTAVAATPADGIEDVGSVVSFAVTFGEIVDVTGGTPLLLLNDGGVAHYVSGSGTDTLVYQYSGRGGREHARPCDRRRQRQRRRDQGSRRQRS